MSTCLRPSVLAFVLLAALAQTGSAGMVGFTVSPTVPAPDASLETKADGSIVGTNLNVSVVFGAANPAEMPIQYAIGAYLDFSTGALIGTDARGNRTYGATNANFFILGGKLEDPTHGAGSPPLAFSVDMLTTVTPPTSPSGNYSLVATLLAAYLDPTIAQSFGMSGGSTFTGTFSLTFFFDPSKAGNQVVSGGVNLNQNLPAISVPAPPSLVLAAFGVVGMAGGQVRLRVRNRRTLAVA